MGKRAKRQYKMARMAEGGVVDTLRNRDKQIEAAVNSAVAPAPAPAPVVAPAPAPASVSIVPGLADQMAAKQAARVKAEADAAAAAAAAAAPKKKFLGLFADGGGIGPMGFRVSKGFSPWERDDQGNLPSEWGRDASGGLPSEWSKPQQNTGMKFGSLVQDDDGGYSLMSNPLAPQKPKEENKGFGLHFADGDEVLNRRVPLAPEVSSDYGYGNERLTGGPRMDITQTGRIGGTVSNPGASRDYDRDTGLVDSRTMQYFRPPTVDPADTTNVPGMQNPSALNASREGLRSPLQQFPRGERVGHVSNLVGMSAYGGKVPSYTGAPLTEESRSANAMPPTRITPTSSERTSEDRSAGAYPVLPPSTGSGRTQADRSAGGVPAVSAPTPSADTKNITALPTTPTGPTAPAPAAPTRRGPTLSDLIVPPRPAAPTAPGQPIVVTGQRPSLRESYSIRDRGEPTGPLAGPTPQAPVPDVTGGRHPFNETQVPMQHVRVAATKYGIPHEIAEAQIHAESRGNPKAVGPMTRRGASEGLAQILPSTGKAYGVKNPFDAPEAADFYGVYMRDLMKQHGGNMDEALAAYNTGPGNLAKAKRAAAKKGTTWMDEVPQETRNYVTQINERAEENRKRGYADGGAITTAWGGPVEDNESTRIHSPIYKGPGGIWDGMPMFADGGGVAPARGHKVGRRHGMKALLADGGQINRKGLRGGIKDGVFYGEGGPTQDKVHIRASPGEFIIPADSAEAIGKNKLRKMVAATHTPVHLNHGLRNGYAGVAGADPEVVPWYKKIGRIGLNLAQDTYGLGKRIVTGGAKKVADIVGPDPNSPKAQFAAQEALQQQWEKAAQPVNRAAVMDAADTAANEAARRAGAQAAAQAAGRQAAADAAARAAAGGPAYAPNYSVPPGGGPVPPSAGAPGPRPMPSGYPGGIGSQYVPPPGPTSGGVGAAPASAAGNVMPGPRPTVGTSYNLPPNPNLAAEAAEAAAQAAPGYKPPGMIRSGWELGKDLVKGAFSPQGMRANIGLYAATHSTELGEPEDPTGRAMQKEWQRSGLRAKDEVNNLSDRQRYLLMQEVNSGDPVRKEMALRTILGSNPQDYDPDYKPPGKHVPTMTPEQTKAYAAGMVQAGEGGAFPDTAMNRGLREAGITEPLSPKRDVLPRAGIDNAADLKPIEGGGYASGIDPETGQPRLVTYRGKQDFPDIQGVSDTSTPEEKAADKARRADWVAQSQAIDDKNAKAADFERRSLRDMVQQNQQNTANYDLQQGLRNRDPAAVAAAQSVLGQVREGQNRQGILDVRAQEAAAADAHAKAQAEATRYAGELGLRGHQVTANATLEAAKYKADYDAKQAALGRADKNRGEMQPWLDKHSMESGGTDTKGNPLPDKPNLDFQREWKDFVVSKAVENPKWLKDHGITSLDQATTTDLEPIMREFKNERDIEANTPLDPGDPRLRGMLQGVKVRDLDTKDFVNWRSEGQDNAISLGQGLRKWDPFFTSPEQKTLVTLQYPDRIGHNVVFADVIRDNPQLARRIIQHVRASEGNDKADRLKNMYLRNRPDEKN